MKTCPKCGSYLPDGKILCPACGRLNVGISDNARESIRSERVRTHTRIQDAHKEVKRDAWLSAKQKNPYQGHTYEQHKSHDPRSKDYYKPKYETNTSSLPEMSQRIICAAAYFGFFFFLPLVLMPSSREAKFHANQGLVLFLFNLICSVFGSALSAVFGGIFEIIAVLPPILMVYGAANAYRGNMTELPFIGKIRLISDDQNMFGGRRGL